MKTHRYILALTATYLLSQSPVAAKLPTLNNNNANNTANQQQNNYEWTNQAYQNYGNQYQDPYTNQNYYNQNASTMRFGGYNMAVSSSGSDLFSLIQSTQGTLGQRLSEAVRDGYVRPMVNKLLAGIIGRLPKLALGSSVSGQGNGQSGPMVGLPPECNPFFMYNRQQQGLLQ